MNTQDLIAYLIISIPFFKMVILDQNDLTKKKQLFIYLVIGILSWMAGIIYFDLSTSEHKYFVYFSSQTTLYFLILYNVVAIPYRKFFKRNPEISQAPTNLIDIIPSSIVMMGTILMPLLIDIYLIKYVIN